MILAAGLTPAWQQIMLFDRLLAGEVNRAREVHWCGSGKVLNVGMAIQHLAGNSRVLCPLAGPAREPIQSEFAQFGVSARWLEASVPTRICTTLLDGATGLTTELVENAAPISRLDLESFIAAYSQEVAGAELVVLSGSLPKGTPTTFYRDLLSKSSARVVLDARGPELLESLAAKPFVIKPNREELGQTFGKNLTSDEDLHWAMQELNNRGAEWVVVSQGKAAVWVTSRTERYRLQPPTVPVLNPIGCGDCLAAGIAVALSRGKTVLDAVHYGISAAAENAQQLLPARLDPRRVALTLDSVRSNRD